MMDNEYYKLRKEVREKFLWARDSELHWLSGAIEYIDDVHCDAVEFNEAPLQESSKKALLSVLQYTDNIPMDVIPHNFDYVGDHVSIPDLITHAGSVCEQAESLGLNKIKEIVSNLLEVIIASKEFIVHEIAVSGGLDLENIYLTRIGEALRTHFDARYALAYFLRHFEEELRKPKEERG